MFTNDLFNTPCLQFGGGGYYLNDAIWSTAWEKNATLNSSTQNGKTPYDIDSFRYTHNFQGFRCDDLRTLDDTKPVVVFVGCSYTYGTGLPIDKTWAHIVWRRIVDELGVEFAYCNVSRAGASLDFLTRMVYLISQRNNIDAVFGLLPPIQRAELVVESYDGIPNFINPVVKAREGLSDYTMRMIDTYKHSLMLDEAYVAYQLNKNLAFLDVMLKNAAQDYSFWHPDAVEEARFIEQKYLKHFQNSGRLIKKPVVDALTGKNIYARDLSHASAEAHQQYADSVVDTQISRLKEVLCKKGKHV